MVGSPVGFCRGESIKEAIDSAFEGIEAWWWKAR